MALLGERNFFALWLTGAMIAVVRWLEVLAIGVFAFDLTGSALVLSILLLLRMVPMSVVGFWVALVADHGVHVKWFGRDEPVGFTSRHDHWRYVDEQALHATSTVLAGLCDLRIPLSMAPGHCRDVAAVLRGALDAVGPPSGGAP